MSVYNSRQPHECQFLSNGSHMNVSFQVMAATRMSVFKSRQPHECQFSSHGGHTNVSFQVTAATWMSVFKSRRPHEYQFSSYGSHMNVSFQVTAATWMSVYKSLLGLDQRKQVSSLLSVTLTGPGSPCNDIITPCAWQGSHKNGSF